MTAPLITSVQVGRRRTYSWLGRELSTSIVKTPVPGPVLVHHDRLDGDVQADPEHHGGPDKAVYAYAREDLDWWADQLGRPTENGLFGENLTTAGHDLRRAVVGELWRVGSAVLQVTEPRTPCWKLGWRLGDPAFPRRFGAARRTGVLLRVVQTGVLQAGDPFEVVDRPAHGITVDDINAVYYERGRDLTPIRAAPELAAHWRDWADHRTVWHLHDEQDKGIAIDEPAR